MSIMKPSVMMKWLKTSPKYIDKFNHYNLNLTDTSLKNIPFHKGFELFNLLLSKNKPHKIEIGKSFPIYDYLNKIPLPLVYSVSNSLDMKKVALNNIQHISCISSVSENYMKKKYNITLEENKMNISNIVHIVNQLNKINEPNERISKKLYISCVNQCPYFGKIDNDFILHEIFHYNMKHNFDEICISDTNGSLTYEDYKYIVDTVVFFGVPKTILSLDLYLNTRNFTEIEKIIRYSLRNNICRFNVSLINDGSLLQPLSYEILYEIVKKEIEYSIWVDENIIKF